MALLSVATLAACSGKTASESSSKNAKASPSRVEKSSTSESKSSSSSKSSKSATSSVDVPEIALTTEEIDTKTLGDKETIYGKMIDNYTKYVSEIASKIPKHLVKMPIQASRSCDPIYGDRKSLTTLSAAGSDDTRVPEQVSVNSHNN